MKFFARTASVFALRLMVAALALAGAASLAPAAPLVPDPSVGLSASLTGKRSVRVSWSAANGVSYQLESSADLKGWTAAAPLLVGKGSTLNVTNVIGVGSHLFYRVGRAFVTGKGPVFFDTATGVLTVVGDDLGRTILVGRDTSGNIVVIIAGVVAPITGGVPTVATTTLIQVLGGAGDDQILIDPASGIVIPAHLFGGAGNDTLTGGQGPDVLAGGPGNDALSGGRGNDQLFGGDGDDVVSWNPGDTSDLVEGGGGRDTLVFSGANINERFDFSANGGRLRFTRDVAAVTMDIAGVESVQLRALGGADSITVNDLSSTDVRSLIFDLQSSGGGGDGSVDTVTLTGTPGTDTITAAELGSAVGVSGLPMALSIVGAEPTDALIINAGAGDDVVDLQGLQTLFTCTVDGGPGKDTLTGTRRADVLIGGDDDDRINGGPGDDTLLGGPGADTFVWVPGDGSDVVEGQDGLDTLVFTGSNINELVDLSANGSRLRFFRDVANVVMDCNGVERIVYNPLGGVDTITVNDLTGTSVTGITLNLARAANGVDGDGQPDLVILNGTPARDTIQVAGAPGNIVVSGLPAQVKILNSEPTLDTLTVNALGGPDEINASGLVAGVIKLTLNGGSDSDVIIGSQGDDLISGGQGNDVVFGGPGNDTFVWNPGDGTDVIEGQEGNDTLNFNGANINERINLSANGARLLFTRDVANISLDCKGVEQISFNAQGGADTITVNNLTGTDVTALKIDLSAPAGSGAGDGAADSVIVNATAAADVVTVRSSGGVIVAGLVPDITILGSEDVNDRLIVNGLGGDDAIDASALPAGFISLTLDGGEGADVVVGSAGGDILFGGAGDDILIGGPGIDVIDGGPGNNVILQN